MTTSIVKASSEDIFRWPDGTTCYRHEWQTGHYACMSDDFEVITEASPEYELISSGGTGPGASFMDPNWQQPAGTAVPRSAYFAESLDTGEADAVVP